MMQKPDVDHIDGLSPAISIEQKTTSQQPALDRRHGHRDLRLHAAALGARRHPLFAGDRAAHREPDGQPDGRPRAGAARGHAALSAGADRARAEGRIPQGIRRAAEEGLPAASRSTASSTRSPRRPTLDKKFKHDIDVVVDRVVVRARHRARGSPIRSRRRSGCPTRHRRSPSSPTRRDEADHLLGEVRLPGLGLHHRGDRAAAVLVQQPLRRLSRMRRARHRAVLRAGPGGARRKPEPRRAAPSRPGRAPPPPRPITSRRWKRSPAPIASR